MRKAFTLSFDEEWVARIDEARGLVPRSRWIELLGTPMASSQFAAEMSRSPVVPVDSAVSRGPSPAVQAPAPRRHSPTCSCAVCKPVKS